MNRVLYILLLFFLSANIANALIEDNFVNNSLKDDLIKPEVNSVYDYSDTLRIPIKLKITTAVKSELDLCEGQILNFVVSENVTYRRKLIIRANTPVTARVETIIANGMNGIPASVILGNFEIANIKKSRLSNDFEKYGFDLSLFVYPLKWALTPLPPTGSLTNFIKGGHAQITKNDDIVVYYHPNWL